MLSKMAAVLKQWREASTLILVTARQKGSNVKPNFVSSSATPANGPKGANLEVLLLKRSAKSKFMPNLYVFPGGVASDVDFSADWIPIFDLLGKDHRQALFDFVQRGGQGVPMFSRLREQRFSHIPSEIAFRICAIRETFEESGVLIARRLEKGKDFRPSLWHGESWASYCQDESIIHKWRQRVDKDPSEFLVMCRELDMVPDVWSLYEWSNWLTPCGSQHRFDTSFFVCCVDGKPAVAEDEGEMVHYQWGSPYNILHQYYEANVSLGPPQLYEIRRLMEFSTVPELLKHAWQCGQHRVEQFLPVRVGASDCMLSVLPGDSLYPPDTDPEGPAVPHTHNRTLAELDESHPFKHRFVVYPVSQQRGPKMFYHVACNITLPGQHVSPRSTEGMLSEDSPKFTPRL